MPTLRHKLNSCSLPLNYISIVILLLTGSIQMFAQPHNETNIAQPQVEIAGTQMLKIFSSITNQEYVLDINLPQGYDDTTKTFPVLFHIDAQWDFPLVQAVYGQEYYDGFVPGIVIVGITWGGTNPDYDKLRAHDLTPTDVGGKGQHGNAANFLSFIKNELIPFIESKYRVKKDDRALMGSSLGGLFTLYTMFTEPGLFNRFVLTSPAINWDNELMFSIMKKFGEKKDELPAKLFMAIGGYENVPQFQKFADELRAMDLKGLEMQTKVLEGMGHSGGKAEGYSRGLQFVYSYEPLHLASEILDQYVGEYEIGPMGYVKLERENDHLIGSVPDNLNIVLYAKTETDFYTKGAYLIVHFQKDETGKVTGFQAEQYDGSFVGKKVK